MLSFITEGMGRLSFFPTRTSSSTSKMRYKYQRGRSRGEHHRRVLVALKAIKTRYRWAGTLIIPPLPQHSYNRQGGAIRPRRQSWLSSEKDSRRHTSATTAAKLPGNYYIYPNLTQRRTSGASQATQPHTVLHHTRNPLPTPITERGSTKLSGNTTQYREASSARD